MHLDMQTARYVIGPDKPTGGRRPASPKLRKPPPSEAQPKLTPPDRWPAAALITLAGLASAMALLGGLLMHSVKRQQAETGRANAATVQADAIQKRLFKLAAEYDSLSEDRRSLLRSVRSAQTKEEDARRLALQWSKAHAAAQTEAFNVATRWSEHSSSLERNLNAARVQTLDLKDELKTERIVAAQQADHLNREIEGLAKGKAAVEQEADSYHRLARELDSTAGSLRSEVSRLQSDKSSLQGENSSLRSENCSLRSEISCLNSKISSLQSELCSLRSQLANARH